MSDEKDTAASPESEETTASPALNDEEQAKLTELQAKQAEHDAEAAEKAAAEAKAAKAEELERVANRPLYHVLVRHMARSPRTRTMRAARSGHRRQGVILDDGKRIRKKGRRRYTEVDLREMVRNNQRLLEYVRIGAIEVCDPKNEQAIPYEGLVELLGSVAMWVATREMDVADEAHAKAMEAWEEACEAETALAKEEKRDPVLPLKPEEPKEIAPVGIDESGTLAQDPVLGSTPENAAPQADPDATKPDMGQGAVLAAVDQHEAEASGEAGTGLLEDDGADAGEGDEEGDDGHTEEELLAMKLDELKTLAVETYGVDEETVSPMRAKKDVVAAIFSQGEGEE